MTENQMQMVLLLHKCTFLPGSFEKRFTKTLFLRMAKSEDIKPLTIKQANYLAQLFHRYRKQIGTKDHNCYCELCQRAIEAIS